MFDLPTSTSRRMVCNFKASFYIGFEIGVIAQICAKSVLFHLYQSKSGVTVWPINFIIFLIVLTLHSTKFSYLSDLKRKTWSSTRNQDNTFCLTGNTPLSDVLKTDVFNKSLICTYVSEFACSYEIFRHLDSSSGFICIQKYIIMAKSIKSSQLYKITNIFS